MKDDEEDIGALIYEGSQPIVLLFPSGIKECDSVKLSAIVKFLLKWV
jgi:hypothetical protein